MLSGRKLALYALGLVMSFSLLFTAWSSVAVLTVAKPAVVKGWLDKSGTYDKVVSIVLDSAQSSLEKNDSGTIPVNLPELRAIAEKSFTPLLLKSNSEKALDGTYSWLDGTTETPQFTLDFANAKQQLSSGIGDYVTKRLAALPVCKKTDKIDTENYDAFSAQCRPAGVDPVAAGKEISTQLSSDSSFLNNPQLQASELTVENNGQKQPFYVAAKSAPKTFQLFTLSPWLFGACALLCAGLIVFATKPRVRSLSRLGRVFIGAALAVGVVDIMMHISSSRLTNQLVFGSSASDGTKQLIGKLVGVMFSDFTKVLTWFAVVYLAIGVGTIVAHIILQKKARYSGAGTAGKAETQDGDKQVAKMSEGTGDHLDELAKDKKPVATPVPTPAPAAVVEKAESPVEAEKPARDEKSDKSAKTEKSEKTEKKDAKK